MTLTDLIRDGRHAPVAVHASQIAQAIYARLTEHRPATTEEISGLLKLSAACRAHADADAARRREHTRALCDLEGAARSLMLTREPEAIDEARDLAERWGFDLSDIDPGEDGMYGEADDIRADDARDRARDMALEAKALGAVL